MTEHYEVPKENWRGFLNVFSHYSIPNAVLTPSPIRNGIIKVRITVPLKAHKSTLEAIQTSLLLPKESDIF